MLHRSPGRARPEARRRARGPRPRRTASTRWFTHGSPSGSAPGQPGEPQHGALDRHRRVRRGERHDRLAAPCAPGCGPCGPRPGRARAWSSSGHEVSPVVGCLVVGVDGTAGDHGLQAHRDRSCRARATEARARRPAGRSTTRPPGRPASRRRARRRDSQMASVAGSPGARTPPRRPAARQPPRVCAREGRARRQPLGGLVVVDGSPDRRPGASGVTGASDPNASGMPAACIGGERVEGRRAARRRAGRRTCPSDRPTTRRRPAGRWPRRRAGRRSALAAASTISTCSSRCRAARTDLDRRSRRLPRRSRRRRSSMAPSPITWYPAWTPATEQAMTWSRIVGGIGVGDTAGVRVVVALAQEGGARADRAVDEVVTGRACGAERHGDVGPPPSPQYPTTSSPDSGPTVVSRSVKSSALEMSGPPSSWTMPMPSDAACVAGRPAGRPVRWVGVTESRAIRRTT